MRDLLPFKGHFKIQSIDKNDNVVDVYEDDNMIMLDARTTMAEIFANLNTPKPFIDSFRLSTMGHLNAHDAATESIITPKTPAEGYVMERGRLFGESVTATVGVTSLVLQTNDVVNFTDAAVPGYYVYLGTTNYPNAMTVSQADIDGVLWASFGAVAPYTYNIDFVLPGNNSTPAALSVVETDVGSGSEVTVVQSGSSVTFTIDVAGVAAIGQTGTTSTFTEAALYANGSIFSHKTFKAKIKDSSVTLRIIWTITF